MHINHTVFLKIIGFLTTLCGIAMFPCALVGFLLGENIAAGALSSSSLFFTMTGAVIHAATRLNHIKLRYHEGWLIACVSWVYCSLLGTVPVYFCGRDYTFIGSFFEAVAGLLPRDALYSILILCQNAFFFGKLFPAGLAAWVS